MPWTVFRRGCAAVVVSAAALVLPGAEAATQTPAGALRRQAEQFRREQRLPEALQAYRAVVALEPEGFEDRFWVAKLESWTGQWEAADSGLVKLLEERPEDHDSRIALADVRLWRGRPSEARLVLENLRRTHPADPEVLRRLEVLRRWSPPVRWEADLAYYGERLDGQPATHGATLSLGARLTERLHWRGAATVQEKFDRTESRLGGTVAYRVAPLLGVQASVQLAPGADVLPRQSYGLGLDHRILRPLVLYAEYELLDFADADVHRLGPALELYAGRWLLSARYRYAATRFAGTTAAAGNHSGSLTLGYLYGGANLVRVFAGAGGESFAQPSRDLIGDFHAHTVGAGWRHFLTPGFGIEVAFAHQDRSAGANQDCYSLRLVRRW